MEREDLMRITALVCQKRRVRGQTENVGMAQRNHAEMTVLLLDYAKELVVDLEIESTDNVDRCWKTVGGRNSLFPEVFEKVRYVDTGVESFGVCMLPMKEGTNSGDFGAIDHVDEQPFDSGKHLSILCVQ